MQPNYHDNDSRIKCVTVTVFDKRHYSCIFKKVLTEYIYHFLYVLQ